MLSKDTSLVLPCQKQSSFNSSENGSLQENPQMSHSLEFLPVLLWHSLLLSTLLSKKLLPYADRWHLLHFFFQKAFWKNKQVFSFKSCTMLSLGKICMLRSLLFIQPPYNRDSSSHDHDLFCSFIPSWLLAFFSFFSSLLSVCWSNMPLHNGKQTQSLQWCWSSEW